MRRLENFMPTWWRITTMAMSETTAEQRRMIGINAVDDHGLALTRMAKQVPFYRASGVGAPW